MAADRIASRLGGVPLADLRPLMVSASTPICSPADSHPRQSRTPTWSDPRLTDTHCEATCNRLGRSPDASSTSAGVPSTRCRARCVTSRSRRSPGISDSCLRDRMAQADVDDDTRPGLSSDERAELVALRPKNRVLEMDQRSTSRRRVCSSTLGRSGASPIPPGRPGPVVGASSHPTANERRKGLPRRRHRRDRWPVIGCIPWRVGTGDALQALFAHQPLDPACGSPHDRARAAA
jgi:hypothetical protein